MNEKIKSSVPFNITINDVNYNCVIYTEASSLVHEFFHYISINKAIIKKFLFWHYKTHEHVTTQIIGDNNYVKHEYHDNCYYYDVNDVKIWCKKAITDYEDKIYFNNKRKNKIDTYKILTEIK